MPLPEEERHALIRRYQGYAEGLGLEILKTLPGFVRADDVKSAANEGLVDAASRYDPTRGVPFTSFAYYRIRGAVFDWVRGQCENDPYHLARAAAQRATDALAERVGESPSPPGADLASQSIRDLDALIDGAVASFMLGEAAGYYGPEPDAHTNPAVSAEKRIAAERIRAAVDRLPDNERTLVSRVYFDDMTIDQAGKTLGLSKSWASRLHARALGRLREQIDPDDAT
jgi:RNA polymerase sigma factor for flagellar operon FliA